MKMPSVPPSPKPAKKEDKPSLKAAKKAVAKVESEVYVPIDQILTDDRRTQLRVAMSPSAISDFADNLEALPPVLLMMDEASLKDRPRYWVIDGWHRIAAYKQLSQNMVKAKLSEPGGIEDAIVAAAGANSDQNSVRLSRADKRNQVRQVLAIHWEWPDRKVASACGSVSHTFVAQMRTVIRAEEQTQKDREASGLPPVATEALEGPLPDAGPAAATLPSERAEAPPAPVKAKDNTEARKAEVEKAEAEMNSWLDELPLMQRMRPGPARDAARLDAAIWRKARASVDDFVAKLQGSVGHLLREYKSRFPGKHQGPYVRILRSVATAPAPINWECCMACSGTGIDDAADSHQDCPTCRGFGYHVEPIKGAK